ncbi:4-amino-4-deoxy-L-arabinose transferase [Rubidibacter lacunae KORDI 51-2]|uniref:4-amino-4-deoxy-L-arabinose transferase n=1 Tax=Rubidibacter lacunae KORDI 51-2 TaxID=582515 RepID=U5DRG6_9CHRO|nr:phospholipid carrier-dependent glycosyltransferase [Rubidibacter lacunae]ERN43204.1 4-amino-4-deoxy-L-arabinose transferase [Rubidibacter lacunae KORDI 51-2]
MKRFAVWRDRLSRSPIAVLTGLWLLTTVVDGLWWWRDRRPPAWDQADYLNGVVAYWHALQAPHWFQPDWWAQFWQLTTKIPPLTYIIAALPFDRLGQTADAATAVLTLFNGLLLIAVYGVGVQLFGPRTGLWAAGICTLLPGLYRYRTEFLLDVPVAAAVALGLWLLTAWRVRSQPGTIASARSIRPALAWWLALALGLALGSAILIKQTVLLFLCVPIAWLLVASLWQRQWQRVGQLVLGAIVAVAIAYPWYRTNWLLVLTGSKRATLDAAIAEGDPALTSPEAWLYYLQVLPLLLSVPLIVVPLAGWLRALWRDRAKPAGSPHIAAAWRWLAVLLVGGYLLCSLNVNKDARYILPLLPVLSIVLARGLLHWGWRVRWSAIALSALLMVLNLFPLNIPFGDALVQHLSPHVRHHPDRASYPHREMVDAIVAKTPYLQATLGVLPSTPQINQHNVSFYGGLADYRVYGRQVGIREREVEQDARSLDWFLTKTGDPGSVPAARALISQLVTTSSDFETIRTWVLPDGSSLHLHHRRLPSATVKALAPPDGRVLTPTPAEPGTRSSKPIKEKAAVPPGDRLRLARVELPERLPPGTPAPVVYEWRGSWDALHDNIILVSWHRVGSDPLSCPQSQCWVHDRAIAGGFLHAGSEIPSGFWEVRDRTAMLPPADLIPGEYVLAAFACNRVTSELAPLPVPPAVVTIAPDTAPVPAPELDLPTQFRELALLLPAGEPALERVFTEIARLNQYDPTQDYLQQTALALTQRLQADPQRRDRAYALGLARALQQNPRDAIAAFERVTGLDSQNPYAFVYLAAVNLYDWRTGAARHAISRGLELAPDLPLLHALNAVAALMRGNLLGAWQSGDRYLTVSATHLPARSLARADTPINEQSRGVLHSEGNAGVEPSLSYAPNPARAHTSGLPQSNFPAPASF